MKDEKDTCYSWQRSTSEKLVFGFSESCICDGGLLNYKMCLFTIFFLRSNIYRKKVTSLLAEKTWADLRDHYNNMELKVFCKVLFLVRFFFPIWFADNKNKVRNHNGNVSSETLRRRNFWRNRWRDVELAISFTWSLFQKWRYSKC